MNDNMYEVFGIESEIVKKSEEIEERLKPIFKEYENNCLKASGKVLKAFQNNKVATTDFNEVTGYGYYDGGREKLERVYADVFRAEDALVRPQIMSGTHAISLCLFGLLKYGDTMISISGEPYETLKSVIGTAGDSENSLLKHGIKYEEIDLIDSDFDYERIAERLKENNVRLVEIQRSRGYSLRKSINIDKIERVIKTIREVNQGVIIMVDNCYGEFVEEKDPIEVGADIFASSLMKNLGAGIATSGGYVVGKKKLIHMVAEALTTPCIGKDLGANFNQLLSYYKGLFMAPKVVEQALKTMTFASALLEENGFKISPSYDEKRADIIQTIELGTEENLIKFCQGMQKGSPVEAYVIPEPDDMPGYSHKEIMAGGTFTPGATIELSCDGPLCSPYIAYMQGGLTYEYGKLGVMMGLQNMQSNK